MVAQLIHLLLEHIFEAEYIGFPVSEGLIGSEHAYNHESGYNETVGRILELLILIQNGKAYQYKEDDYDDEGQH